MEIGTINLWDEEDEYYQKINVNDTNYAKLKFNKKTYLINSCFTVFWDTFGYYLH